MSKDFCHNSSGQHISQTNIKINLSFLPKHLFWYKDTRTLFFWNYKSQSQSSYQTGSLRRSTAIRRKKFIKVWDYLFYPFIRPVHRMHTSRFNKHMQGLSRSADSVIAETPRKLVYQHYYLYHLEFISSNNNIYIGIERLFLYF